MKTDLERLAASFASGSHEAFEEMYQALERPVFNVALRMVGDRDDARDICQITFLKAYQRIGDYDPRYRFFSWVYRIAVNESLNHIKRHGRRSSAVPDEPSRAPSPEAACHGQEVGRLIQEALMQLPDRQRAGIILRHFRDCTYRDIAAILDVPVSTVKSDLYLARQRLQERLQVAGALKW